MNAAEFRVELGHIDRERPGIGRSCSLGDLRDIFPPENIIHDIHKGMMGEARSSVIVILEDDIFWAPSEVTPLFDNRFNILLEQAKWGVDARAEIKEMVAAHDQAQHRLLSI